MNPDELLKQVTIPSPCTASWDSMEGDDHARFCRECGKSVVNLRAMSKEEAASLVTEQGDHLCARITRSKGGSVVTRPALGPLRFNICSLIVLIAYLGAMLGFMRFIATSTVVTAGMVVRVPPMPAPSGPSTSPPGAQEELCGEVPEDEGQ